ncbi:LacI family transcriptional regulator [Cellulomonas hominis]|uniref:LacI family DNA-binding transcriptional regulator n=1 Tax=Cellulomonas hominis TaxID=156981 RepID=UPI001C12605B|nr:LacI family DNA-binding transcriptional regulator [Cellulomonas hominis]MBU5421765.1 LacI family transcriptional regulator [Cellulomonas hominis]
MARTSGNVTMADVGERAGVTARTVSNVLSGHPSVRRETRDRVLRAVDELGYRLNTSARGLRTGRTGAITLAIPDLGIDYFTDLARRIMTEAERHDWTVVIQQTGARRDNEIAILSGARRQHSDGLIFQPHALGPGDEKYLTGNDRLVVLGDRIFHGPVDHVTMANTDAARLATQYLVDRGHRRIAAIGANPRVPTTSAASLRLGAFRDTLAENGLPVPDEYVVTAEEWHLRDGAAGMARLLALPEPPDAVFCFNDTMAFGALHVLASRGLRVPEDVAVIGFDNVPMAEFTTPPLTTVEPGTAQLAKQAVDLLAARVAGGEGPPTEVFTDCSLVVRRSA